jgi:hypothetical protein
MVILFDIKQTYTQPRENTKYTYTHYHTNADRKGGYNLGAYDHETAGLVQYTPVHNYEGGLFKLL